MIDDVIKYTFLAIFAITAIITLLGIIGKPPFEKIERRYLNALFGSLILELITIVIFAGQIAFSPAEIDREVDRYKWEITYPRDLRESFEKEMLKDEVFAKFYKKNKFIFLGKIESDELVGEVFENYVDIIFILKKAAEFANRNARGELFIIRDGDGPTYGTAVLTFPNESQPIAFDVKESPDGSGEWRLVFEQPDRFVLYEGRINKWRGGLLTVDFSFKQGVWSGDLIFLDKIDVGRFSLVKN